MGFENLLSKSNAQLQRHIRTISRTTAAVFFTKHARFRMKERGIGILVTVMETGN